MNITGFRVTIPGSQPIAIPAHLVTYLGLIGGVAITFFTSVLGLFHLRANQHTVLLTRGSILSYKLVVPLAALGTAALLYLANERRFIRPGVQVLPFDPLASTILVIIHVAMIISALKLAEIF